MSDSNTPPSPPSSSSPPSPPWWQSAAASLPGTVTALAAIWVVGRPLGQALPALIAEMGRNGRWQPVAANLLALGLLVAPVPTLALARSLLSRLPLLRNDEPKRKD
jgi:hypothetical protein